MRIKLRIHYDNNNNFTEPILWVWQEGTGLIKKELRPSGSDDFGPYYDLQINRSAFNFKFKDIGGKNIVWEGDKSNRFYNTGFGDEIWCKAGWHNIYSVRPEAAVGDIKDIYNEIKDLIPKENFYLPNTDISRLETNSLLGAHKLLDGSISFAFFHPRAAKVYLASNINGFKAPYKIHGRRCKEEDKFIEMKLYRGYYNNPNIWWTRVMKEDINSSLEEVEYKFYVQGGTKGNEGFVYDPYTRLYSSDYRMENCVVVDPTEFQWSDEEWNTPDIKDLIIYELNVYGFTDQDSDISLEEQSTFKGVTKRIKEGYFNNLGVTALAFMPTSEAWSSFGLGYDPCSFMSVEKDFGRPDDFRELVDVAHNYGLAVIIDQVFNHTSNDFNPLWKLIDDGSDPGGFYFSGATQWGNRLATGKAEVDNMLIDSCKLFIEEYHIDGFRFDATHTNYMDHRLLYRLQDEIRDKGFKRDAVMIVENLPNQPDLNFDGFNGYAQWSDIFHDKLKAILREGQFRNHWDDSPDNLGDIFYFSKNQFASHTNNVINYSESHDETSIKFEIETNDIINCDIKDRKARLALFATMVALGQPMIYMGQEFGVNREANKIDINKITPDPNCPEFEYNDFYRWAQGIINLRKKYDALRISGYNPIDTGEFQWLIGPWLKESQGKGKRVIGWKVRSAKEEIIVLINFERDRVKVKLPICDRENWVKIADIKEVDDITINKGIEKVLGVRLLKGDGRVKNLNLDPYSAFIYKKI
ncbi:alpha-amylase family glycosyl hydrolase [Halonatronum saccharophilum]|uniref:alpha-amylase family glycosyl hydrolase n=1 Tax=Halonatronum saccharophilum TaxID=150060 RepID=UPI0004890529|nr:alpha-amylase family glycosyl hydrolase [Halonatronum saccharophilum]